MLCTVDDQSDVVGFHEVCICRCIEASYPDAIENFFWWEHGYSVWFINVFVFCKIPSIMGLSIHPLPS